MTQVQLGDHVQIQYLELRPSGKVIGPPRGRQVLEFTVGSDEVIPGISRGVVGMVEGQEKRLTLAPEDAYGAVRSKLIKEIDRRRFPASLELRVGQRLKTKKANSTRSRRVKVVELKPDSVVVDANHRLAGEVVEVELQLISLQSSAPAAE